jgi:asparagine synthase (glutamine-hydrolysing)
MNVEDRSPLMSSEVQRGAREGETALWGVCGWFGDVRSGDSPTQALHRMRLEFCEPEGDGFFIVREKAALFLSSKTPGAVLAEDENITIAVFGYPYWSDGEIAQIAAEHGHGAAALAAYQRFGNDMLQRLHGPFGIIVFDEKEEKALIAIDRLGIYPMVIHRSGSSGIVFGTTATVVARHPAASAAVSPQGVFNYLFFYRVPAPTSIFEGQEKLLPAQYVLFARGRIDTGFYWQMPFGVNQKIDHAQLRDALFERFREAIRRNVGLENLANIGTFLSGGLDSSTVTGLVQELSDEPVMAFTVGFDAKEYDETIAAETIAKHFGVRHHIYRVTDEDVVEAIHRIAAAYDEPFGNASAVPVYYCAQFARQHGAKLLLAGDGGDELFAGNKIYLQMKIFELYTLLPKVLRRAFIEPLVNSARPLDWMTPVRKAHRYISQANIPMPDRMVADQLARLANMEEILDPEMAAEIDPMQPLNILREVYDRPEQATFEQRMHHLEVQSVLADNDLRKVNRMCELAGVRVRFPVLDEAVVNFSAMVPSELFLKGLQLRAFYKKAMRGYLPGKTIRKRKHGFGLPYGPLLRRGTRLQTAAYDSLQTLKVRGYVRADHIDRLLNRHYRSGLSSDAAAIWDLMMLELWQATRENSTT